MLRADAEYYDTPNPDGLQGTVRQQLERTPWWMISVAFHAVGALILYFVMFDVRPVPELTEVTMNVEEPPEKDPFEDEIPEEPDVLEKDLPPSEVEFEHPELSKEDVEPSVEENVEDEPSGEPDRQSDRPSNNDYAYAAIGVGGGAEGMWGRRGLGGKFTKGRGGPPGGPRRLEVVQAGLGWLVRHQRRDGAWSCDGFHHECERNVCDGAGDTADYTPGTTGLATLAFLGAGHTQRHGKYREVVKRAVHYLTSIQTPDGCVGPKVQDGHYIYNHAICAMALAEAYGMTGSASLKRPAQLAVDYLVRCQNPYLGWRYGERPGDNDTSITGWAVLALKSAKLSKLNVPAEAFQGAKAWVVQATDESYYRTGYKQKGDNGARLPSASQYQPTEAMTAAGLASRIFMGARRDDPAVQGGASVLRNDLPKWEPDTGNDFYYWYYGTLAMFQLGGQDWAVWERGIDQAVVKTQRRGGDENGSWDPTSAWGGAGGRVYATAINTLTLEVYYRYSKVLQERRR